MTEFGKPGSYEQLPDDVEPPPTPEQVADGLEARKGGTAKDKFKAERRASVDRGNRKR
jgi:hypothetical protein